MPSGFQENMVWVEVHILAGSQIWFQALLFKDFPMKNPNNIKEIQSRMQLKKVRAELSEPERDSISRKRTVAENWQIQVKSDAKVDEQNLCL